MASARFSAPVAAALPGVALTAAIAAAAFALRRLPGVGLFSPMILATIIGIAIHNFIGTPRAAAPGITFSLRRVLRLGIILLGFQLMLSQVVAVGITGLAIILVVLVGTFFFTRWMGVVLGVDAKLAELIGAGTSICGASAVIATNTVTQGKDSDVAYAVASVTVFGSLSMLLYPLLPGVLHIGPQAFGLWSGASIHEIAQVVAAAFRRRSAATPPMARSPVAMRIMDAGSGVAVWGPLNSKLSSTAKPSWPLKLSCTLSANPEYSPGQ